MPCIAGTWYITLMALLGQLLDTPVVVFVLLLCESYHNTHSMPFSHSPLPSCVIASVGARIGSPLPWLQVKGGSLAPRPTPFFVTKYMSTTCLCQQHVCVNNTFVSTTCLCQQHVYVNNMFMSTTCLCQHKLKSNNRTGLKTRPKKYCLKLWYLKVMW